MSGQSHSPLAWVEMHIVWFCASFVEGHTGVFRHHLHRLLHGVRDIDWANTVGNCYKFSRKITQTQKDTKHWPIISLQDEPKEGWITNGTETFPLTAGQVASRAFLTDYHKVVEWCSSMQFDPTHTHQLYRPTRENLWKLFYVHTSIIMSPSTMATSKLSISVRNKENIKNGKLN